MSWKCWFFHKWTKWINGEFNDTKGDFLGQERYCSKCNKRQVIRTIVVNG